MLNHPEAARPTQRWQRFWLRLLDFSLIKIGLAVVFLGAGVLAAQAIGALLGRLVSPHSLPGALLAILAALLAGYGAYRAYARLVERRAPAELSFHAAGWELITGLLIGLGLCGVVIAILAGVGVYHLAGWNGWMAVLPALVANLPSGFFQELFFRGVLLRMVNEKLGSWLAILLSALLFGLIHLFSAQATLVSTLAVAAEAGILLAAAYLLTGRLWLAIGIHVAWDVANDGIFGVGAAGFSGAPIQGILHATLSGSPLLSGGANGVEASLVSFVVIGIACVRLVVLARRQAQWRGSQGRKAGINPLLP